MLSTKKVVKSIVLGTCMLFMWNAISWMVLPFHSNTLQTIPEGVFQSEVLKKFMPHSGVYHYPGLPKNNSSESFKDIESKLTSGPRITMMVYRNEPTKLLDPTTFFWSLMTNAVTAALTYFLLMHFEIRNFKSIIASCITIGMITVLVSDVSQMNWHMFPVGYSLVNIIDKLISFVLLGIIFGFMSMRNQKYA